MAISPAVRLLLDCANAFVPRASKPAPTVAPAAVSPVFRKLRRFPLLNKLGFSFILILFQLAVQAALLRYFFTSGGKWSNIFCTSELSLLMFLSDLSDSVSLAEPRQISFLALVSNRSTTSVPTVYVSSVVVDVPKPSPNPLPQRRQPQPPPKLS